MTAVLGGIIIALIAGAGGVVAALAALRGVRETNEIAARNAAREEAESAVATLTGLNGTLKETVADQQRQITDLSVRVAACDQEKHVLGLRMDALANEFATYKREHP